MPSLKEGLSTLGNNSQIILYFSACSGYEIDVLKENSAIVPNRDLRLGRAEAQSGLVGDTTDE